MSVKDTKTLDKLKKFFSFQKNASGVHRSREDTFTFTNELEKELSPDIPMPNRVKILKDLTDNVTYCNIDDQTVAKLWSLVKDLLEPSIPRESRHVVFDFFRALIQDKHDKLGIMRKQFFILIKDFEASEDVGPRLRLLQSLTNNGRYLLYFEEEVGPFFLDWMSQVVDSKNEIEYLSILLNIVKYNATYIDENIVAGLVQNICVLCCNTGQEKVVLACLDVLHAVICYSTLPTESLTSFVATLCRTINLEIYCRPSWRIMKNLLGTHLGHSSLHTMSNILKTETTGIDNGMLRGAVCYIHMALWGNHRVTSLECSPASVLPAIHACLECKHPTVYYEVILSIQSLVSRHSREIVGHSWDIIFKILRDIIVFSGECTPCPVLTALTSQLHETLDAIEHLLDSPSFHGNIETFYSIIESCASTRSDSSVLKLMAYLSSFVDPYKHKWAEKLDSLLLKFFVNEKRTIIRVKALSILTEAGNLGRFIYEDEIVGLVVKHLGDIDTENDISVKVPAIELLVNLCDTCQPHNVIKVLDLVNRVISQVYDNKVVVSSEEEGVCLNLCTKGLVQVLRTYLYHRHPEPAIKAYSSIRYHLKQHYNSPNYLFAVPSIRSLMLKCLLDLRADKWYQVGLQSENRFSVYVVTSSASDSESTPLTVSLAVEVIVKAIQQEEDWKVLAAVLEELPLLLKNKALLVSRSGSEDVHQIAAAVCSMICNSAQYTPEQLKNTPTKFTRSEIQNYVFPVIESLVPYHDHLEPSLQQTIIKCLEKGLVSKSAGKCVSALTLCMLEMKDAMVKLLPEVLLNLSKISATVHIAIPILEFLSTLTQMPYVFANFIADQYMSLFAISLPYTNPCNYNHYIVSLAHHVIAAWFLKCRLTFRKGFVDFILKALKANIAPWLEDSIVYKTEVTNEDSSTRKRSSSLTEQGSRRREKSVQQQIKPAQDDMMLRSFHKEVTETCVDLMSMYSFANISPLPRRHSTAEMILNEGQSMSWLVGSKIITVTTSGCSLKPLKHGLCDHCFQVCRVNPGASGSSSVEGSSEEKKKSHLLHETRPSTSVPVSPEDEFQELHLPKLNLILPGEEKKGRIVCGCWCQGWAEIMIRRPTGTVSWMVKIQNESPGFFSDRSQCDLSSLFLPNADSTSQTQASKFERVCSQPMSIPGSPIRRNSNYSHYDDIEFEVDGRSRNPVRRSNSSPEMSSSWKSPLAVESEIVEPKKKHTYGKEHRLNCEVIPEEMGGTTPPTYMNEALMLAAMDHVDTGPPVHLAPTKVEEVGVKPSCTSYRERGHTISVMSPIRKPTSRDQRPYSPRTKEQSRSGLNPAFVFLQLYHSTYFASTHDRPIRLTQQVHSTLKRFDWISPYESHKIGVLYVGPGQTNSEVEILRNECGSLRYTEFLQRLGTLINLSEADGSHIYLGGLQTNGNDGQFAYVWHEDIMQVIFHVATLMPNSPNDLNANNKKAHIGNNFITIVYNDSGEEYDYQTLKAQFNSAVIVIEPLDYGTCQIKIKGKEDLVKCIRHTERAIVSDQSVALLARQLAVHADLAAVVESNKANSREPFAWNWLERLRWIKRTQAKLENTEPSERQRPHLRRSHFVDVFTDYT